MPTDIAGNIAKVLHRIGAAAERYGRDANGVTLLAVSKMQSPAAVRLAAEAGVLHIGENYLQEALDKMTALADLPLCWHFIGPIQSNKTRLIAENFAWVHSVDRLKIAERLAAQRPAELPPLNICLQVNIDAEATKSGVRPAELPALARAVGHLPRLHLRGLMAIPQPSSDFTSQRHACGRLRALCDVLRDELALDTLSMGMSTDLEAAVAEGATLVRIGSDIFGARVPRAI